MTSNTLQTTSFSARRPKITLWVLALITTVCALCYFLREQEASYSNDEIQTINKKNASIYHVGTDSIVVESDPSMLPNAASPQNLSKDMQHNESKRVQAMVTDNVEEVFGVGGPLASVPKSTVKEVVTTFITSTYLDTLSVWLHYYKQHNHSGRILCLFAMTNETFHQMKSVFESNQHGIIDSLGPIIVVKAPIDGHHDNRHRNDFQKLLTVRIQMIRRILETFENLNVIGTDVDALWVNDPQSIYRATEHATSDLIASRGKYPDWCRLATENDTGKSSAAACEGFVFYRNKPSTRKLMARVESILPDHIFDAQRALNCAISEGYKQLSDSTLEDRSFELSYDQNLKVTLLPYSQIRRQCDPKMFKNTTLRSEIVVAHCMSAKNGPKKLEAFEKLGLLDNYTVFDWF